MINSYGIDPVDRCNPPILRPECSLTLDCGNGRSCAGVLQQLSRPAARPFRPSPTRREIWIGQIGTTERLGNNFWREVSFTLQTAGGDATPTIIDRRRP